MENENQNNLSNEENFENEEEQNTNYLNQRENILNNFTKDDF